MSKKQSFIRGVVLLTVAGIVVKLVGFIYRVILTNMSGYGDEGNGIYGAGYQVYLILYVFSTTGFPAAISKLVAEKSAVKDYSGAHKIFKVSFWLLFSIGISISTLFFISSKYIAVLISNQRTTYTMMALAPTILFVSLMAVFRGYFQGMQDMGPQARSQIIEQVGKTVLTIGLAYLLLPYGVEYSAAGATLGTTIGAAIGFAYLFNLYNKRKRQLWNNINKYKTKKNQEPVFRIIKNIIKLSIPISIGAGILTISNLIDLATIMGQLEKAGFTNIEANELYGILTGKCYVLTHFPVTINVALATSLVPVISSSIALKNFKAASDKICTSLRITTLIAFPATIGIAVLSQPILSMLFPNSNEGAYLLVLSSFTIIFIGLTETLSGVLQGLGKVMVPAFSLLIGAVVKLIINFILVPIPHINIKGAIYGTIICYMVATLFNYYLLKKNLRLNLSIYNFIIKPLAASSIMGISGYYLYKVLFRYLENNSFATLGTILLCVVIYVFIILIIGGVDKKDFVAIPHGQEISELLMKIGLLKN